MDEAWKLGLGRYLQLHGLTSKTELMRIHLAKVMDIIRELGVDFDLEQVDGKWLIKDAPEDLAKVMLSNFLESLQGLF